MKYRTTTFLGFCALFIALPLGNLLADKPNKRHVPAQYPNIQAAIDDAQNGDVIVIAAGKYSPTATIDTLGKAITLRGAVDRKGLPATIIDGQGKMRVLQCVSNEGSGTVIQNLEIRDGNPINNVKDPLFGGGMFCLDSSPTVSNCIFRNNSAWRGGGVYYSRQSEHVDSLSFTGCAFTGNVGDDSGGGVYCSGQWNNEDSVTFTGCTFTDNEAEYEGGGMYCEYVDAVALTQTVFSENKTGQTDPDGNVLRKGGGLRLVNSSPTLNDCRFENNQSDFGGGVCCSGQAEHEVSFAFTGCTFKGIKGGKDRGQRAEYSGGGVFCECVDFSKSSDAATFVDCDFDGNHAAGTMIGDLQYGRREGGGGMSLRMCVYPPTTKKTEEGTLHKCRFANNRAPCSGGLLLDESQGVVHPLLTDCTFRENSCVVDVARNGNGGGGIGMFRSRPTIRACVFESNFVEFVGRNGKGGDIGGGGAMRTWFNSGTTSEENTVIEGCTFTNNYASGGASGGAYLFDGGNDHADPQITLCQFTGNSALGGHGGAVYNIGPGGVPNFSNCRFEDNCADAGGGMYNIRCSPTLTDCTLTGNSADVEDGDGTPGIRLDGGGMYNFDHSSPALVDCTLTGNSAVEYGGGIYNDQTSSPTLDGCEVTCNVAENGVGGGIYTELPSAGPTLSNTHVCCNTPDQIYKFWTDDGGNTVRDTSPDLNGDGTVDGADVGLLLVDWGSTGDCLPSDLNCDGQVDGADFGLLLTAWGGQL